MSRSKNGCLPEGTTADGLLRTAASAATRARTRAEAGQCVSALDFLLDADVMLAVAGSAEPGSTRRGIGPEASEMVYQARKLFTKRCIVRS